MIDPAASAAYSKVSNLTPKLAEALADLRRAGGLRGVSRHVRPASVARVAEALAALRGQIDLELAELARPAPAVAPRPLLRRQANRPDPIPTGSGATRGA